MVASAIVAGEFETAKRLVDLLEQDGFGLNFAIWAVDDEGRGRLFLVPRSPNPDRLGQTVRVAYTMSAHKDELPDRHDLKYTIVDMAHPIVRAIASQAHATGKIQGLYSDGVYFDTAYVLRPLAR